MTLDELFRSLADDVEGVEAVAVAGGTEWRRGGHAFVVLRGDRADFRLIGPVGRAARGTPDTGDSARGPGWISFSPRELDGMALDRAAAWFENAALHAGS